MLTALLGMVFVRSEGRTIIGRIQHRLARGDRPTDELLDGALLLLGAGVLITPGLVIDLTGVLLVVRVSRRCHEALEWLPFLECGAEVLDVVTSWTWPSIIVRAAVKMEVTDNVNLELVEQTILHFIREKGMEG